MHLSSTPDLCSSWEQEHISYTICLTAYSKRKSMHTGYVQQDRTQIEKTAASFILFCNIYAQCGWCAQLLQLQAPIQIVQCLVHRSLTSCSSTHSSEDACLALQVRNPKADEGEAVKAFTFDQVYDWTSSQMEIFDITAKPIIDSAMEGYNGTIFAYGQVRGGSCWDVQTGASHGS